MLAAMLEGNNLFLIHLISTGLAEEVPAVGNKKSRDGGYICTSIGQRNNWAGTYERMNMRAPEF